MPALSSVQLVGISPAGFADVVTTDGRHYCFMLCGGRAPVPVNMRTANGEPVGGSHNQHSTPDPAVVAKLVDDRRRRAK